MRRFLFILIVLFGLAACQTEAEPLVLPTEAELPTLPPTETTVPTDTATFTAAPTDTPTITPTPSDTPTPTDIPTRTDIPTDEPTGLPTVNQTSAAQGTGTAAVEEAPRISTLTPVPPGVTTRPTPTGTPLVAADVTITERQFQEEVSLAIDSLPNVQQARVNFTPDGILVTFTARAEGDAAFTTGQLLIEITVDHGVAQFQGQLIIEADQPEPSEVFITYATGDFFLQMIEILDSILNARLGEGHNLENIVVTDDALEIMLLIRDPSP